MASVGVFPATTILLAACATFSYQSTIGSGNQSQGACYLPTRATIEVCYFFLRHTLILGALRPLPKPGLETSKKATKETKPPMA